ncbi:TIR domain-containing protein [uncultured Maribacter sp.]|uniref:toll/interleukin-1 receptor domain-containing protein n=1 Tax=Maribacter stanieri TaxID=440514 RepID=UPI0030D890A1|tara:strand:- start:1122 stop:2186 length:1065 start_codon:yes stop_codon:yes gene_type:complete
MAKKIDIFISHSGKDKQIVDNFIDLILHGALSVPISKIFCTSTDGTKIKSGTDWRNSILDALQTAKINFLIISPNYKESEVCMNEMGAGWVTSAEVIPMIIEPINYKTVGVIQEPIQIEKLLDEKSLDRVRDILQEKLNIPTSEIKSDRWTAKKKEFVIKTKNYIKDNEFKKPLDRDEFDELIQEKEEFETTLTKLIEEKSELENLVEELKNVKDKSEIDSIVRKYSDTSDFEEFEALTKKLDEALTSFHPIIVGIIFKTYAYKDINIEALAYREQLDEALANDFINEDMEANFGKTRKMQKLELLLEELSSFMQKDLPSDFEEQFEQEYEDAPFSMDNKLFWEDVLGQTLYFS